MHTLSRRGRSSASRLLHEKKRCPGAARRGRRRPGRGWTGLLPRAVGCGGLREADICGGKRPQPGWAEPPRGPPLPEGSLAGRATLHPARLPGLRHTGTGSGHIPKIQSLSDAPTGKGFQSQPPRGGRKSRRDALSANTATVPRGERLQTHLPRLLGQARRPRGGRAARWFPLEGDRRPRGERHPARLPGKGTAATCRTASGFRPRPLP